MILPDMIIGGVVGLYSSVSQPTKLAVLTLGLTRTQGSLGIRA
jgi:hypothetical protein